VQQECLQVAKLLKIYLLTNNIKEWVVTSPLYVLKNLKGDKWYLNQNNYRNTHFQALNNYKKKYKKHIEPQVSQLPWFNIVSITLTIYPKSKRLFDLDNIAAVHCKFFLDSLSEALKIEDDNYLFVPEIHTYFGNIDKINPRVDISIKELK